ncbi:hypothetical protein [Flavobacterium sp.]|uniref:hypothetical protein n=1 Tax=Flavobacterium sp. TaxID=239 RepID=UPI002FDB7AFA
MNTIIYLKDVPLFKKILGFVILVFGLYTFIFANIIFGAIFLVIGLNLLSTEGSEIHLENNSFRNIKSIFGYNFGKWKQCPEFEYVSVFKTKENQTIRVVTAEATLQSDVILLNLFYKGNKHITFYKTQDKNDAFNVAEKFKSIFKIDILDATESEKKWL